MAELSPAERAEAYGVRKPTNGPGTRRPRNPGGAADAAKRMLGAPRPKVPDSTGGQRQARTEAVQTTLGLVSTGFMMAGLGLGKPVLLDDAGAVAVHAEPVADAVAGYAEQNDFIAGILDKLEIVNGVAALAVTLMPLALQILVNHRATTPEGQARVKEMAPSLEQFGVFEPDVLRAKVQAEHAAKVARIQADLLQEQIHAETELQKLRDQMSTAAAG